MTKTADWDEELELKKRARRRLVGAVVFVSVAAVMLPLVMDEEPPRLAEGIELHIPAQEKGFTPPAPATSTSEKMPSASPAQEVVSTTVLAPAPTPLSAAAAPDAAEQPVAQPAIPASPRPAEETKTPGAKAAPAAAARPPAANDGKADKPGSKGGNGQYIVLIGAFANTSNVQVIQKKLGEMGIRVFTEALDTPQGRKTRVRAGPFPTQEAAAKAAARMKKIGIAGVVTAKS